LMVCCPMTTQIKNHPFEVRIAGTTPSAVLTDHVKSLDWRERRVARKGVVSAEELADVRAKIFALLGGQKSY
jgi:mRNA interferase MazF